MNPDRWQHISRIYHAALAREGSQRSAFLAEACGGDESLRRELESLLRHQDQASEFLQVPAFEVAGETLAHGAEPVVGHRLAHYQILDKIGAGGMGQVFRARDEQLHRDVAIKILPGDRFSDATARERLLREARLAASLNHPNICTVHEVGEAESQIYFVMELVEGQSLSALLADRPLSEGDLLRYGLQASEAVAYAHDRGVVHRDLKTTNVAITPEGRVKILDFGLAKRLSADELAETTQSRALLTQPGMLVGTLAYMAPEQLRGQPADTRSDVWALGVVLYEMAVGARPFEGLTAFELSSAILHESPPPLPSHVPPALRAVVERCLEKEPARRYQRGGEVRVALEAIQRDAATSRRARPAWPRAVRPPWLAPIAAGLAVAAVLLGLNVGELRERFGSGAPSIQSLAVLPLANVSGDPDQEYFADGMTEALITELGQIAALRVISRTSSMAYKSAPKALPEIARELQVDAVVEGSVLRAGGRVGITVQLIDARTDRQIWSQNYERESVDVLRLRSDVARAIARQVQVRLTAQEEQNLAQAGPVNPSAYEAYLRGRHLANQFTEEGFRKAIEYFRAAIDEDAGYAPGYAGLAYGYGLLGTFGHLAPAEAFPEAKAHALKALEIDPTLAEAHTWLAWVLGFYEWDWEAADREFARALELNPGYALG